MVRYIYKERVTVHSKFDMIAVTQELEAGVECNISKLKISFETIGYDHADALSKLVRALMNKPTLESLHISRIGISFENATCISNLLDPNINPLGRLNVLKLNESKVTDEHVVEICKGLNNNKFILKLSFIDNKIGNSGAKALGKIIATNESLYSISLWYNEISDAGAKALAEGIMQRQYPSHSNIARHFSTQPRKEFELILDYNRISDLGAKAFASLLHKQHSALSPLVTLTKLHLSKCNIGDEGAVAIAESLKSYNTDIGLETLSLIGKGFRNELRRNLIGNTGAIAFANALKENKVLTYLDLGNNDIQLGGLALCRTMESYNDTLQTFRLYDNPCSDLKWKNDVSITSFLINSKRNHDKKIATEYKQRVKAINIFKFIASKGPYEMSH